MSALTPKTFTSQVKTINTFGQGLSNDIIKNEPMFFNSGFDFAMEKGGDITRAFLNALPLDWKRSGMVFDSRVHMLMPGWYPAIPGWHHDDVPRVGDGQPDYEKPAYRSEHILGLVNAAVCPTHFAVGICTMPAVRDGEVIYKYWDKEVSKLIADERMYIEVSKDRTMYYFDCDTFHTGTKAVANGWRWFGRVSRYTDRVKSITNEIRVNAQVYLEFPTQGW
ncbi:MAG: hypothetical protein ACTHMC_09795 [Pseudobacter sp.]|uniref:hypothetical protein n=1 Tax=Pseudobacter sp. TaxID=2045420 RepID=UPI003F80D905